MSVESLVEKFKDSVFTLNVTYIDTYSNKIPPSTLTTIKPAGYQQKLRGYSSGVTSFKSSFSNSKDMVVTTELKQLKLKGSDTEVGLKCITKIPYFITNFRDKTMEYYMQLVITALIKDIAACRFINTYGDVNKKFKQTIIHFELFDETEQVVFAPLDLIHPVGVDYESGRFGFISHRYSEPACFSEGSTNFVLLKRTTDYSTVEGIVSTSLDISTGLLNSLTNKIDLQSVNSIYSGLPSDDTFFVPENISLACSYENTLIYFSDSININF